MTAKDRWTVDLECPKCKRTGEAHLWQYDGWSFASDQNTYIDFVSEGFKPVAAEIGYDFHCIEHGLKS
jgi:hypothetical protein